MNKATFQYLCNELRGHVQRTNLVREAISVEKRIAITLCPWGSPILAGCPLGRQVQASKPLGMVAEGYPWAPNDWTISAIICCTEDINCLSLSASCSEICCAISNRFLSISAALPYSSTDQPALLQPHCQLLLLPSVVLSLSSFSLVCTPFYREKALQYQHQVCLKVQSPLLQ